MISPVKLWRNQKNIRKLVGLTGKILTWTIIRVPPNGFSDQAPYAVAIIELEDRKRITCQLVDMVVADIRMGLLVKLTIRRIKSPDEDGVIWYGVKATPTMTHHE